MAQHHSSSLFLLNEFFFLLLFVLATFSSSSATTCRYESIFSFGDSYAETGNGMFLAQNGFNLPNAGVPPYGETYFHHPTGRFSDGRVVIDFIAEHLRLPFVPPYYGGSLKSFRKIGVNFAVVGATALDVDFLRERGIVIPQMSNFSLNVQLGLFKKLLPSLCNTRSNCRKLLGNSLVVLGEIGGNDFNDAFLAGVSVEVINEILPHVINTIGLAIKELIELGARTILVPGNIPIGCLPGFLTVFSDSDKNEYDNSTGCLNRFNNFTKYYNEQLVGKLNQIRELHPYAKIIYADYYNAAMRFIQSPNQFGFTGGVIKACCGGGGPYNFNLSVGCGNPLATVCDDPSLYASWDGAHFTEAANKLIFRSIIEGPYSSPRFNASCIVNSRYPQL